MFVFLFLFVCLFALFHFIWESILAPSIRLGIRFDLFAIRDELRKLKISNPDLPDDAFSVVQEGVNSVIQVLYEIDIPLLTHCDSYIAKDPQLKGRVDKRRAILEKANSKELNALTFRMRKKLEHAAVVNSGSWFLYIVPIAIVGSLFKWVCAPAMNIIFVSRSELQKIAPARELEVSPA